jgi:pimeloyl-ACP methyl ester carboxylesterase
MTSTHRVTGGGGVGLRVDETGNRSGRPILFIHGFSQCRLSWRRQLDAAGILADRFRLLAIDIRGHGDSDTPEDPQSYTESRPWADDVAAVIDQLRVDHPVLVGWSYAGVIVGDYLAIHGEDAIAATVWVGAVSSLGPAARPVLGDRFVALVPGFFSADATESVAAMSAFVRLCTHDEPSPDEFFRTLGYNVAVRPEVRRALFDRTIDHTDTLRRLKTPALVVHGEEDAIVLIRSGEATAATIPNAELARYEQTGHTPFIEAPARFDADLAGFVERL